jgi:hypothetical protein
MDEVLRREWQSQLRHVLKALPDDYAQAKAEAIELSRMFHEELARSMGPKLNAALEQMPRRTLVQCRSLASFANSELADLHLCIRCPRTGLGTVLFADIRDVEHDTPRFRLQTRGGRGQVSRTYASHDLPVLELMGDIAGLSRKEKKGGHER